jgi:flagellar motor switch protein FliN
VQPYPWNHLPFVSKTEVSAIAHFNACSHSVVFEKALTRLQGESGAQLAMKSGPARLVRTASDARSGLELAVVIGAQEGGLQQGVLIEAESALALALLGLALKRVDDKPVEPARMPPDRVAGAYAALLLHLFREGDQAPRILAAGPSEALMSDMQRLALPLVMQELSIEVRGRTYRARMTAAHADLRSPARPWRDAELAGLGSMPIALPIVYACILLAPDELRDLEPGDIVMAMQSGGVPKDAMHLANGASEWALKIVREGEQWSLATANALVQLTYTAEEVTPHEGEEPMKEALETVPVLARVEIGSVTLSASEWSKLKPGDSIALGRKPGDPVTLRVAGIEVAKGELVVIEGETGVRILSRTTASESPGLGSTTA